MNLMFKHDTAAHSRSSYFLVLVVLTCIEKAANITWILPLKNSYIPGAPFVWMNTDPAFYQYNAPGWDGSSDCFQPFIKSASRSGFYLIFYRPQPLAGAGTISLSWLAVCGRFAQLSQNQAQSKPRSVKTK